MSTKTIEDTLDQFREEKRWDDVKKHHKQYMKLLKQKKEMNSRYSNESDRIAYAETVKADHSISKRGRDGSAWKHLQLALNASPNFPEAIALATIIQLNRSRYPKNTNLFSDMKQSFTSVKKSISKWKGQTQPVASTDEPSVSLEGEVVEEDDNSEEEEEGVEEYNVQKQGWKVILSLDLSSIQSYLPSFSKYQTVMVCVALALGGDALYHNDADIGEHERLLLMLWEILTQYSRFVLHTTSPFAVLQRVPLFNSTIVYDVCAQLPQYFLSHASLSVAVATYRTLLSTAGRFPSSPFSTPCYLDLLQRYVDLLIHVLHDSPSYPAVTMDDGMEEDDMEEDQHEMEEDQHNAFHPHRQIPATALEEAMMLLLVLRDELGEIGSVRKVLEVCGMAFDAYNLAGLPDEGVKYLEHGVTALGHSALLWYMIATLHHSSRKDVLCLQSLQNCMRDLEEYGNDEENSTKVDMSMTLLFCGRVCLSRLGRVDDCRHFASRVLQKETKAEPISQAFHLLGMCSLLEARSSPFFSRRRELLGESIRFLREAKSYSATSNMLIDYNLSLACSETGERDMAKEAIELLEKALQSNPCFEPAWQLLILLAFPRHGYDASLQRIRQARRAVGDSLWLQLTECKLRFSQEGKDCLKDIISFNDELMFRRVSKGVRGSDDEQMDSEIIAGMAYSESFEEGVSGAFEFDMLGVDGEVHNLVLDSLLFCCRVYTSLGLTTEAEKALQLSESLCGDDLKGQVHVWNEEFTERARLLCAEGNREEAERLLGRSKMYLPELLETQLLEAGLLVNNATATIEEISKMHKEGKSTLDALLTLEHTCSKQLLAADEVLRGVVQRDQRISSAWELWGCVLELLGNKDKAAEALMTGLEWDNVNSFESVGCCGVVM